VSAVNFPVALQKCAKLLLIGILICLATGFVYAQNVNNQAVNKRGKEVFDLWCGSCHKPLGQYVSSVAGTSVLERKYKKEIPSALEDRTDLTPSLVKYFVRHGVKFMPFTRKTELGDEDLDALALYLYRDPKGLERAAADVAAGKVPSRIGRDLPHIFMLDTSGDSLKPAPQPVATERLTPLQANGKALFEKACLYCHGEGKFGTLTLAKRLQELNEQFESLPQQMKASAAPAKRVGADQAELVKRDNLAPDYIRCVVHTGVRNMPQYPLLDLSNAEIDSISAYLTRNNPVAIAPVARGIDCQPLE
jgi:mono/diheme cytochrome c family protein